VYLNDNLLTGSLPSSLGRLTQLERLDLFRCLLTGPLIPELGQMVTLSKLYLNGNMLTGPIQPALGQLLLLENLDLFNNRLTGVIPAELSRLTHLERIRFEKNELEGSLPSFLGNLTGLTFFSVASNALTGSLISVSSLLSLKRLLLQNNQFTGEVSESLFHKNMSLEVLDFSHNRLSGTIPPFLFQLPRILTIALSLNCFRGKLPPEMCFARELLVLAMDGLGVARECPDQKQLPFSGVILGNTLVGTIPSCLWSLPHIELLHLSGNGLTGTISESIPRDSPMKDLSIGRYCKLSRCVCFFMLLYCTVLYCDVGDYFIYVV
jgi:Leucine-rich repeat (LRR) protein